MTDASGVDYAWARPSPTRLAQSGYSFVCRYLSHDPSKDITASEAADLASAGLWSVVVWETTAARATGSLTAGQEDAKLASQLATQVGMPDDRPIYFAVDVDTDGPSVRNYFQGVVNILGVERTGVYGGIKPVTWLATNDLASWFWQTLAWSGGQWYAGNHIEQYAIEKTVVGVSGIDLNRAKQTDYGQWMPGRSPDMSNITKDVWSVDGVLDSPPSRQQGDVDAGRPVNKYWAAKSYFKEIYEQNVVIQARQADILAAIQDLSAKVDGLGAPAAADAKAIVDELIKRLNGEPSVPPAPPAG